MMLYDWYEDSPRTSRKVRGELLAMLFIYFSMLALGYAHHLFPVAMRFLIPSRIAHSASETQEQPIDVGEY